MATVKPRNLSGFVVGVDAGGTASRAALMSIGGQVLGRGDSGAANPNSVSAPVAADNIREAITKALADNESKVDISEISGCVMGFAGTSSLTNPAIARVFHDAWIDLGLNCPIEIISDIEIAFASATAESNGAVLISGTGSMAGTIENRRLIRTAGGYGWLLGDEGSAFWLGREAIRETLAALEQNHPIKGLFASVIHTVLGMSTVDEIAHSERTAIRRRLIAAINGQPPIKLASYAPLVSSAENRGDQTAIRITQRAARLLIENLRTLRTNPKNPLVLIGSVLGASSPVGREVRRELADLTPLDSPGAELGAAWLAAMRASGGEVPHPVSG